VVGYVLPASSPDKGRGSTGPAWTTGPWFFRDERMYLVPGDSAHGPAPALGLAALGQ